MRAEIRLDSPLSKVSLLPLTPSSGFWKTPRLPDYRYDAAHDRLFVAKEREPRKLDAISGVKASLGGKLQINVQDLSRWVERSVFAKDISELHYDAKTGHLLVLSDESKLMIALGENGEVVSFRTLLGRFSDLKERAGQPEGLTLDDQGHLYVVSEPNLFYRFSKN